jgi:putative ABC transport system ATP-binding protein
MKLIEVKKIVKTYTNGDLNTFVLKGIDLSVEKGEFVTIIGRSGAGKSTLLYQMGLLDTPTSGDVIISGKDVSNLSEHERTNFRLKELGYVFQDYALLPDLTAVENVLLPIIMQNIDKKTAYNMAKKALETVGMGDKLDNLPSQLSGGEQQRVSVARAVAHKPNILFADEPTANLDNNSSDLVMNLFKELNEKGQTIIMVTHEDRYGKIGDRVVTIDDGKIL